MIKYVELTSPEASAFRQAKILSIECKEGDQIKEGDTLFKVQSGAHQINLPSTKSGRIVELIVGLHENITLSTALILLETEVTGSTASAPLESPISPDVHKTSSERRNGGVAPTIDPAQEFKLEASDRIEPTLEPIEKKSKASEETKSKASEETKSKASEETKPSSAKENKKSSKKRKKAVKKKHQQQSLNLMGGDLFESQDSSEQQNADHNEVVLTQTVASPTTEIKHQPQPSQTMSSSSIIEVTVPDIGADSAKVIEILVKVGDTVSVEDPVITLESDKASMDVPCTHDGVIKSISVSLDQDVSEGALILELESQASEQTSTADKAEPAVAEESETPKAAVEKAPPASEPVTQTVEVRIPDIGGDSAKVIEILVSVGDAVEIEDPLVTLESDKASMDVPSSSVGVIQSIELSIDQDVSEGALVATVLSDSASTPAKTPEPTQATSTQDSAAAPEKPAETKSPNTNSPEPLGTVNQGKSHASPSIRRFARELGVDLGNVTGSGRKGRVTSDDVKAFVKGALSKPAANATGGSGIPPVPAQDFSKFGEVDVQPLNKIKRLTAENLHRSWLNVPHVTHNDESNITDLEAFRKQLNAEFAKQEQNVKLSPLAFIVKAVVNGLRKYPQFNSSIEPGGQNLIYKKYFNIGIAVETPNGLVVPVLKGADRKSVAEIAEEMGELAKKARDKKLTMNDMSGACITISSLGGIGGTSFTPIVNSPEVAILGVSRSKMQPVWNGSEFTPGMILPLSLSYDHRVIDGAEAARFTRHIAALLEDVRRLTV